MGWEDEADMGASVRSAVDYYDKIPAFVGLLALLASLGICIYSYKAMRLLDDLGQFEIEDLLFFFSLAAMGIGSNFCLYGTVRIIFEIRHRLNDMEGRFRDWNRLNQKMIEQKSRETS
jgi:hypothetical protein